MDEGKQRPAIADLIRAAGTLDTGARRDDDLIGKLGGLAAAVGVGSAAQFAVSYEISQAVTERFDLHSERALDRTFAAPYERTARALILALHATKHELSAAFDTASGAVIESKTPMRLFSMPGTLTLAITDGGAAGTRIAGQSRLDGQVVDWGTNAKILDELFAKTDAYLKLFEA